MGWLILLALFGTLLGAMIFSIGLLPALMLIGGVISITLLLMLAINLIN